MKRFFDNYFLSFTDKILEHKEINPKLLELAHKIKKLKKNKLYIFGNGGSLSISNHVQLDFMNKCKINTYQGNDAGLISCFTNDYGYENWISLVLKKTATNKDLVILISSSGKSKNMLKAFKTANKMGIKNIYSLTGFNKSNPLKKMTKNKSLWVNSKSYNFIENIHQIWLLAMVDYLS